MCRLGGGGANVRDAQMEAGGGCADVYVVYGMCVSGWKRANVWVVCGKGLMSR